MVIPPLRIEDPEDIGADCEYQGSIGELGVPLVGTTSNRVPRSSSYDRLARGCREWKWWMKLV